MNMNIDQLWQNFQSRIAPLISAALGAAGLNQTQTAQVQQLISTATRDTQQPAGNHYVFHVDVDFDGTANQEKPKTVSGIDKDVWIIGATTDLNNALVKITDDSSSYSFSNKRVNVKALAGRESSAQPVRPWKPFLLKAGRTLSLDFKNAPSSADPAGYFAIVGVQANGKE